MASSDRTWDSGDELATAQRSTPKTCAAALVAAVVLAAAHTSRAAEPAAAAPAEPVSAPPALFAAGFALRVPTAATAVRAETAYGLDTGVSSTIVQYLTAAYAPLDRLSFVARGGWVDFVPNTGTPGTAFTNVMLGAQSSDRFGDGWRYAIVAGSGVPVGQGGGDSPDPGAAAAIAAGNLARSRLEGSTMFSPNHVAPFVGGDIAWVSRGWTLQAEANVFELFRVRGAQADPDATKTNLMAAVHAGYFIVQAVSVGVELRDHTFLSTPAAVEAGKTSRTYFSTGGGVRVHLRLGPHVWFRPGLAFFQPLNDTSPTIRASSYHVFQLDLPVTF